MKTSPVRIVAIALLLMSMAGLCAAATVDEDIEALQRDWALANYNASGEAKVKAFDELAHRASMLSAQYPDRAEPLVWEGIVLSTYAGVKGGLGALGLAKQARAKLETAVQLDAQALNGSAYTSLGTLYYKVPGFPLGFGDHKKAVWYLHKALALNPEGIDPNFFYADYLFEEGKYAQAREYLERALHAPSRPGRELADDGRRREINALLEKVKSKLS